MKKMYGSNLADTMIGTKAANTITALGGNDLILTAGGADTILMGDGDDLVTGLSFDLAKLRKSDSRNAHIDGGTGYDVMIVELEPEKKVSEVDDIMKALSVKKVEEFIYVFDSVGGKQSILGSNKTGVTETIVVKSGDAVIDTRGGSDYVFTGDGDDVINGGSGVDFIHAGEGRNSIAGGKGADYFHFQFTGGYQYTEITDFKANEDKIVISVNTEQVNLLYSKTPNWEDLGETLPVRLYGSYFGSSGDINDYVSHDYGRKFDRDSFPDTENASLLDPDYWAEYEQETGSIFLRYYVADGDVLGLYRVLVAHIKPGTDLENSDFLFQVA